MSRFAAAKKQAGTVKKGTNKPKKDTVTLKGLEDLSIVNAIIKQLETLQSTLRAEVNNQMLDVFVEEGLSIRKAPESFSGVDGQAEGSMQLRKRSSRTVLSLNDVDTLKSLGISYSESPDTVYFINKKYADDAKMLDKVSKALDKVPGIPTDFIEASPTKYTTTDDSIDELFKLNLSKQKTRATLQVVASLASRIKYNGDHDGLMAKLAEFIE